MKKLTLAIALLSSLSLAGTALADGNRGNDRSNDRAPNGTILVTDRRTPPIYQPAPVQPPVIVAPPRALPAPIATRWDLVTAQRAPARRGAVALALPARASYDQVRVVASDRGLDITAIELTYARGRTLTVRPKADGMISLDLGRGKVTSIVVRYVNRGAGRDATIKVLAKNDAPIAPVIVGGHGGHGGHRH
jgi:hypothetical protein